MPNLVSAQNLATFLGEDVDTARADMLLADAEGLCLDIVDPLPASAPALIRSVAARQYVNPTGVTTENIGPVGYSRPGGGVYLTRAEIAALRRSAGKGGAFTVDPTPVDAGVGLSAWDVNVTYLEGVPVVDQQPQ
jgi:hypothetical protein